MRARMKPVTPEERLTKSSQLQRHKKRRYADEISKPILSLSGQFSRRTGEPGGPYCETAALPRQRQSSPGQFQDMLAKKVQLNRN